MRIVIPEHRAVSWNDLYEQKHWSKRQRLADTIHEYMWAYLPKDWEKFENRVDVKLTAYFKHGYHRDADNLAVKLYLDGLKGRVLEDDDERFVRRVTTEAIVGAEENKVILDIEETQEG